MLFPTHVLFGIVAFLITKNWFNNGNVAIFFVLVLLGSILPDIDSPGSKINQWSGIFGKWATLLAEHRGYFHSVFFFGLLFLLISYFTSYYYGMALIIGYIAHIIGDGITPRGVKIFYPFSKLKFNGPIKVGSFSETVIFLGSTLLILIIILS
jgi:inner membrane protein